MICRLKICHSCAAGLFPRVCLLNDDGAPIEMSFTADSIKDDNICVIWVDDMIDVFSWRDSFGVRIETPNIDRLMARGVRFSNAYATIPLCAPCRAELATGLSPFRTGLVDLNRVWHETLPPHKSWAYDLRRAGFYNFTTGKVDAHYTPMPPHVKRLLFHEAPQARDKGVCSVTLI